MKKLIVLVFVLFSINNYAQKENTFWRYDSVENIENEYTIIYKIEYDRKLTEKSVRYAPYEKVVTFNSKNMIVRDLIKKIKYSSSEFFNYSKEKKYTCTVYNSTRRAISEPFTQPNIDAVKSNKTKEILGYTCNEYNTLIDGEPYQIFTTKDLGLRYVGDYNIEGFMLEFEAYHKNYGKYKATAVSIQNITLPKSTFSLDKYDIISKEYFEKAQKKNEEEREVIKNNLLNKKAPSIRGYKLNGDLFKSKKELGNLIFVDFTFVTCPACIKSYSNLNRLKNEFKDNSKVKFIAISLSKEYEIQKSLVKHKFEFDQIPEARYIATKYGIRYYPSYVIIDKKGIVRYYNTSTLTNKKLDEIVDVIDELLDE